MSTTARIRVVDTVGDLERLNHRAGHHFFDRDAKGFFSSKILEPIIDHRFFITTERSGFDPGSPRCATVRMIRDDGSVETVGEFNGFASPARARKALKEARRPLGGSDVGTLARGGVAVRLDPYPEDDLIDKETGEGLTERRLFRLFIWRAYVGTLPIGPRTDRTSARAIASEAISACEIR